MGHRKSQVFLNINFALLVATISSFYFCRYVFMPIAILFLLLAVAENNWKERFLLLKERGWLGFAAVMLLFYLMYMAGTLYSENVGPAFSEWEYKIWLLVTPVALLPLLARLSQRQKNLLLTCFVLSVELVAAICLVRSAIRFAITDNLSVFFYTNAGNLPFNSFDHPSYFAMYETVCLVICIEFLRKKDALMENKWLRSLFIAAFAVFPLHLFLLQSKMGILIFCILLLFYVIFLLNARSRRPLLTAIILLVTVGAIALGAMHLNNRVTMSKQLYEQADKSNPAESTSMRIALWECGWEVYREHWAFGVGTGDVQQALHEKELEHGYTYLSQYDHKCHNQYLQNMVASGIPGLLVLLAFVGCPLVIAWRQKDLLTLTVVFIIGCNMLADCVLQFYPGSTFSPIFLALCLSRRETTPCGESWV